MHIAPRSQSVVFSASLIGSRELITELGGDPEPIMRAAGVPAHAFEAPDVYIDAACLIDYLELAAEACDCPEFGLLHGSRLPMGIFGQIWLMMRDAESVFAALECFVKYYGLFTDMGTFRFEREADGQWLHYSLQPLGHYGLVYDVPQPMLHSFLAWVRPIGEGADLVFREIPDLSHTYPREENDRILDWLLS